MTNNIISVISLKQCGNAGATVSKSNRNFGKTEQQYQEQVVHVLITTK